MKTLHRMRTARLQTVHSSMATTRCRSGGGQGPQVNKFQQISIVGPQMAVAGEGLGSSSEQF